MTIQAPVTDVHHLATDTHLMYMRYARLSIWLVAEYMPFLTFYEKFEDKIFKVE